MSVPKSVVKIKKDGIEYTSNVDFINYTLKELVRAALRDCGKLFCNRFRQAYYSHFKRRKGRVGKYTQYWVRSKQETPDLLVGIKPNAFYGGMQEFGSSKTPRLGLMTSTVQDNIDNFRDIQAKYLSALNQDNPSIQFNEDDYVGDADGAVSKSTLGSARKSSSKKTKKNTSFIGKTKSTYKKTKSTYKKVKSAYKNIKSGEAFKPKIVKKAESAYKKAVDSATLKVKMPKRVQKVAKAIDKITGKK